ncbi:MAG: FHA domain-containing protein [Chloroflexi bacterium]|nr:FHA domain-containing protein [Chloroflexota bacterium]
MKITRKKLFFTFLPQTLLSCLVVFYLFLGMLSPAFAQMTYRIDLYKPDLSDYPNATAYFRAFDQKGSFIKDLRADNLSIEENNQLVPTESLEILEPGTRFILAVNEGPTLANRYEEVSRIDKIKTALLKWTRAQSVTSMDVFNFVSNTGMLITDLTEPQDWTQIISDYIPDMRQAKPGLASFSQAVDLAISISEIAEKTPAILYVTPLPTEDQITGLNEMLDRAIKNKIRLYVWLIGPASYSTSTEADLFRQAAEKTHGSLFVFSGVEELPDLSTYLDPLRYIYKFTYPSSVKKSGEFTLKLLATQGEIRLESDPVAFSLKVLPPNPIFLSPPSTINRIWTNNSNKRDSVLSSPAVEIQFMVEFPDGLKRDLVYSRLFIDNKLVAENTSPPFEVFSWDISDIEASSSHVMSVVIEDAAGFIAETLELPVDIAVEIKQTTWIEKILSNLNPLLILLILIIMTTGILLTIIAVKKLKKLKAKTQIRFRRELDPVTQAVMIEGVALPATVETENSDEWPRIAGRGAAPARLVSQPIVGSVPSKIFEIPVGKEDISIGSDPKRAKFIIGTSGISPFHARITNDDQNHFKVFDTGSGSGTWINYTPVSMYGARLEHGDLVQFGNIAFRFEIFGDQPKKIRILPDQE